MILDNKKWYKKYATIFWFSLAIMPFIVALIEFIGGFIIHWTEITQYNDILNFIRNDNDFYSIICGQATNFSNFTPSALTNSYDELFTYWGVLGGHRYLSYLFGWFTFTYMIHIVADILIWLPKLFHSWLERWC